LIILDQWYHWKNDLKNGKYGLVYLLDSFFYVSGIGGFVGKAEINPTVLRLKLDFLAYFDPPPPLIAWTTFGV
jgi:hypothetical protein